MKKYFLVLSCLTASAFSQGREPLPPFPEAVYSRDIINESTGEPLPPGKWAFDITIENPNDQPIFCRKAKFLAYLDDYGDGCDSRDRGVYLNLGNSDGELTLKANEILPPFLQVGNNERIAKGGGPTTLEYCGRDVSSMECGFYCEGNKKPDEEWTVTINTNGYKKYLCRRDGTKVETEVFCATGYKPGDNWTDRIGNILYTYSCQPNGSILTQQQIYCDSEHKAGDVWPDSEPFPNGKRSFSCLSDGTIKANIECTQNPPHSLNPDNQCVPASCGSTPHGTRGNLSDVPYGKADYLCDYGNWVQPQVTCNPDAVKENASCRPGNSCGGYAHLTTWSVSGGCDRDCFRRTTDYVCQDGFSRGLKETKKRCTPPRGVTCGPIMD
jgi:hypothetical protein